MNWLTKLYLLQHLVHWRLTWNRRNTKYQAKVPENPKFMSAREAVRQIPDHSVVVTSGLAGNQRPSILYWAIRELFEETGHPRELTVVCTGGQGGRGIAPGTLEELGQEGLCRQLITAHVETFRAMLRLAHAGKLQIHCLPQGIITFLLEGQGQGQESLLSATGTGTFFDPRCGGRGSPLYNPSLPSLIEVAGEQLRYRLPKVNVALFNAPAADREGNIYVKNCAMIAESMEIAKAARKNNGLVIVTVGQIVDRGYSDIFLPHDLVNAIVAYPGTEQTGTVPHRKYWSFLTLDSKMSTAEGIARLRFLNQTAGLTPRRTKVDKVLARLAIAILSKNIPPQAFVNIGTGLPEEISLLAHETGMLSRITLFTESGVIGGLPAPGMFFGAAVNPQQIISSAQVFHKCYENLDMACFGILQADSQGNVNVSKRGEGILNYVGPGGFIDLTTAAKKIVFIGSWMNRAKIEIRNGHMVIVKPGTPKFVAQVDEITFNGQEALRAGKQVFYITHVGAFELTARGMELIYVMPGIDIQKEVIAASPMKIVLPDDGKVPVVDAAIIAGL